MNSDECSWQLYFDMLHAFSCLHHWTWFLLHEPMMTTTICFNSIDTTKKFVKYYCQLILNHDSCNMTVIAQRFWLAYFGLRYFMLHKLCILKSDSYAVDSSSAMFDLNLYFPNTFRKSRTRTKYFQKITDQLGPGPNIFGKSRTNSDQHQKFSENHGPTRTRTKHFREFTEQLGPTPKIFRNLESARTGTRIYMKSLTNSDQYTPIVNELEQSHLFELYPFLLEMLLLCPVKFTWSIQPMVKYETCMWLFNSCC